jgi:hypothetical protein
MRYPQLAVKHSKVEPTIGSQASSTGYKYILSLFLEESYTAVIAGVILSKMAPQ